MLALLVTCLGISLARHGFGLSSPMHWSADHLRLEEGEGHAGPETLDILRLSQRGSALLLLPGLHVRGEEYPLVSLRVEGLSSGTELFLWWRMKGSTGEWRSLPVRHRGEGGVTVDLSEEQPWKGEIAELGFRFRGRLTAPLRVRGVTLGPATVGSALRGLVSGWLEFEPWSGGSINYLNGGDPRSPCPLPLFIAAALAVALAIWWVVFRGLPSAALVAAGLVVSAWLVVDARWQWNLWRQLGMTGRQYAGKTWEERHRVEFDGKLFGFIQRVKASLPRPPARVWYFSSTLYLDARGAYHLFPHNVVSYNYSSFGAMPAPQHFRKGDYVVVYQWRGLRFDGAQGLMSWNGGQREAELIFREGDDMLLRVL